MPRRPVRDNGSAGSSRDGIAGGVGSIGRRVPTLNAFDDVVTQVEVLKLIEAGESVEVRYFVEAQDLERTRRVVYTTQSKTRIDIRRVTQGK